MAVRQYIGARYVLKIYENSQDPQSAEWEAGVSYEPLTMVNYNNSSYISRKDVPGTVGNPVDNPSYWALSGLYNGQIANLQQQVNELTDDVHGVENTTAKNIFAGKSVIRKNLVQRPDYLKTLADTVESCSLQGAAYNSTRNTYLIAILEDNGLVVHLVEISMSDGVTVVTRKSFGDHILGHANDITYNPNTNLYYICTLAEGNLNNEAVSVDADTLDIVDTIQLYPNTTVQQEGSMCIAYDEENDRYFSMSQYAIYVYDKDFNMVKTIDYPLLTSYIVNGFGYSQGVVNAICAYKGYVCLGIFGWATPGQQDGIILALVDPESEETFTTWNIDTTPSNEELEGIFVKDDDIYITCGQLYYSLNRVIVQGKPAFNKEKNVYGGGLLLDSTIDIDNIRDPGKYLVDAATVHNPFAANANMIVWYNGHVCIQMIFRYYSNEQSFLHRFCNPAVGATTWSSWAPFMPSYDENITTSILIDNVVTSGFCTGSSKEIVLTLPVNKKMNSAFLTTGTLTVTGSITARQAGKYIADGVNSDGILHMADCNVTVQGAQNGNMAMIRIKRSDGSAFRYNGTTTTITNNDIISLQTSPSFVITHTPA